MTAVNSRTLALAAWMIASLFYAYQYILRVMPNILLPDIVQQFEISATVFGQFSGVYYIGYALMHMPIGILLDRCGPKKVVSGCILLTVAGLLPLLFATHWIYPIAGRFLIGLGSSAAILGVFKIIRMTFSEKRFARMLSISVTIGLIGAIYGGGPVSYMKELLGYQALIQLIAISGLGLAAITYWMLPDRQSSSQETVLYDVKEVFSNRKVLLSCLFAGLMVGPLEGFADVWATAFLQQVYGMEAALAASMPSMIFIGMCVGAPLLSFIADKVGSYLGVVIGAGVVMTACFSLFLFWTMSSSVLAGSFFFVGVCSAYQVLAIYKASTYVREEVAGLTIAVANMIIMTFGYGFHSVIGAVVQFMGGVTYSQALVCGIAVIPAALCLGIAGFVLLHAKEQKNVENFVIE